MTKCKYCNKPITLNFCDYDKCFNWMGFYIPKNKGNKWNKAI